MLSIMHKYRSHFTIHSIRRREAFDLHSGHFSSGMPAINLTAEQKMQYANSSIMPYTGGLQGVKLELDHYLTNWLWVSMAAIAILLLLIRIYQLLNSHLRHIFSLTADKQQQNYYTFDKSTLWPTFKRQVLYAPLGKKRHNREFQFSRSVNVGTLPTRFQTLILLLYIGSNIAYCCILDYGNSNKAALIAEVRGRTGVLATANMVPLVLLASRNNPAIPFLKVSFDTFNLLHRWMGRVVVAEAIAHTIAWGANSVEAKGMHATMDSLGGDTFLQFGVVGSVAMAVILFQSPSAIRHAFYETFLHLHQCLALMAVIGVYVHIEVAKLPALPYIRAVIAIWAGERLTRLFRLLYLNLSCRHGSTNVVVEALPGDACRVTFNLPRHITVRPGSHVYAYLPSVSFWMSHPFSVAWTSSDSEPPTGLRSESPATPLTPASLERQHKGLSSRHCWKDPTSVSLVMSAREGMTRKLYKRAMAANKRVIRMSGYVEGPYAGHDSLASYGTVILFAGGAGITHHLIQIRHLIASAQAGTVATRRIVLIWTVRTVEALSWVRPWMDEILKMEGRRDILKVQLFVTKPGERRDMVSPSSTVKLYPGRCIPGVILDDELPGRVGATAVSVCGPGAFADEVRMAARERLHWGSLDFVEEAFSW